MSSLYLFNPENDLALANGSPNYYPPPAARKIARDLAVLPVWYSADCSLVAVPENTDNNSVKELAERLDIKSETVEYSKIRSFRSVTQCLPWGWSPCVRKRFTDMGISTEILPSRENVALYRELSNRKRTIDILTMLMHEGVEVPEPLPRYTRSVEEAMHFVETTPRSILKAPWSGSGHGLVWGRGMYERSVEQLSRGIINRQGGIICERALNKVLDFAMEFNVGIENVEFAGYSLFCTDEKGSYQGNLLAEDGYLEKALCRYVRMETLAALRQAMIKVLCSMLVGKYRGVLGVDMMIYDDAGTYRIAPCVELNLRMSMGAVARLFYDRHVERGVAGRFDILHFGKPGEAVRYMKEMRSKYPLVIKNRKLVSGVLSLAPVDGNTGYAAVARCGIEPSELEEFSVQSL